MLALMPNRILREGILTSLRVDSLSESAEVFYRRVMSVVDDQGRHEAHPELLRAACYPLRASKVTARHIVKWIGECEGAKLLLTYKVGSKTYLQLIDWRQPIRSKERIPGPPLQMLADATQMIADDEHPQANESVVRSSYSYSNTSTYSSTAADQQGHPPKKNGHAIAFDFEKGAFEGIQEADELRWQQAFPAVPIPPAIERAAAWLKANPHNRKSNYERFLVNWFSRDQDKAGRVRH